MIRRHCHTLIGYEETMLNKLLFKMALLPYWTSRLLI